MESKAIMNGQSGDESTHGAEFRSLIKGDGTMVAGLAVVRERGARFFVRQKREPEDVFVQRVTHWIRSAGASGLALAPPDVLPESVEIGRLIMRLRVALGAAPAVGDESEFDVKNSTIALAEEIAKAQ